MPGYEAFAGNPPYATEMFGVYQPLIGWKSRLTWLRVARERVHLSEALVQALARDSRIRHDLAQKVRPLGPDAPLTPRVPAFLDTAHTTAVHAAMMKFQTDKGRVPSAAEWPALVTGAISAVQLPPIPPAKDPSPPHVVLGGAPPPASGGQTVLRSGKAPASAVAESVVAGTLTFLGQHAPQVLDSLLLAQLADYVLAARFVDPLASFDPATQRAVLSPIGLVELFREYFYEFDTFLGPPVGHVWVSPGGTVELYEVHTRRSREEKQVETSTETLSRSEQSIVETDELSTAVSRQNAGTINFGVSASGSVDFGVFQAGASASLGLSSAHSSAEVEAHKHSRQQSAKLSSEIRKNFKTVFRTSIEETDTASKRYVLTNTTDGLVNYELRKKFRRVGVQLQHVGTQLCWHVYVDEPGLTLGISELVHLAKTTDLADAGVQPPDAIAYPEPKETEVTVTFPFKTRHLFKDDDSESDPDERYQDGQNGSDLIVFKKKYKAVSPGPGYALKAVNEVNVRGTSAAKDPPSPMAARYPRVKDTTDRFWIVLDDVNFHGQPELLFNLKLIWEPDKVTTDLIDAQNKTKWEEYTEKKKRVQHTDYVSAVRDRVKLASRIDLRDSADLREEERTVIFRRLIGQLMGILPKQAAHVTSELIRAIFDVEAMLYFVAPEWWTPRYRQKQHLSPETEDEDTVLTGTDTVSWGGATSSLRDNYLITEDADPARLGASLGWLLQLDGDAHRNAFLNSPWVKAILPIRPGREHAALNWLKLAHVEGTDGLGDKYDGPEPGLQGKTVEQAILSLASAVTALNQPQSTLAAETVYETGFDPLEGGFRAADPYAVFDQWVEVMPTDQVVAVDYKPPA